MKSVPSQQTCCPLYQVTFTKTAAKAAVAQVVLQIITPHAAPHHAQRKQLPAAILAEATATEVYQTGTHVIQGRSNFGTACLTQQTSRNSSFVARGTCSPLDNVTHTGCQCTGLCKGCLAACCRLTVYRLVCLPVHWQAYTFMQTGTSTAHHNAHHLQGTPFQQASCSFASHSHTAKFTLQMP